MEDRQYRNKDYLVEQYINNHKSVTQIAKENKVKHSTVTFWLNKFGIQKETATPLYQNFDWLNYQYVKQRRTEEEIANELGVDRKTINNWINKFNIKRVKYTELTIEVKCSYCKGIAVKNLTYVLSRIKKEYTKFFCSRECTDCYHANEMMGVNNPNHDGKWHGPDVSTMFTKEERSERSKNQIMKLKETGEFEERMKLLQRGHEKYFSTPEGKLKRIECGINSHLLQCKRGKETAIERTVREVIEGLSIDFTQEKKMYYWVADFYIPKFNLVIEVQGDYWHGNPNKYGEGENKKPLTTKQKKSKQRDREKREYIEGSKKHNYLEIWETDIRNGLAENIITHKLKELGVK